MSVVDGVPLASDALVDLICQRLFPPYVYTERKWSVCSAVCERTISCNRTHVLLIAPSGDERDGAILRCLLCTKEYACLAAFKFKKSEEVHLCQVIDALSDRCTCHSRVIDVPSAKLYSYGSFHNQYALCVARPL